MIFGFEEYPFWKLGSVILEVHLKDMVQYGHGLNLRSYLRRLGGDGWEGMGGVLR